MQNTKLQRISNQYTFIQKYIFQLINNFKTTYFIAFKYMGLSKTT